MKKICLVFLLILLTFNSNAKDLTSKDFELILENAWGCDRLSEEETIKAQNILNSAKKIVNLDGPVALNDIDFENGMILSSNGGNSAQHYYVQQENEQDFTNLGVLIGCQVTDHNLPYKIKNKLLTLEERINNIEIQLSQCESISRENTLTPYQNKINCLKNVAYTFFENFSTNKYQTLKNNFDNYISSYEQIYRDMNYNISACKDFSGNQNEETISKEMVVTIKDLIINYINNLKNCINIDNKLSNI